jgi:hypothetical protein
VRNVSASPAFRRIGFEAELLAPVGASRATVAAALAAAHNGSTVPVFHLDSEPSLVPGRPVFHHLSLGHDVVDDRGAPVARIVDDLTISAELRPDDALGITHRILADDPRLIRLIARHADPTAPIAEVLEPVAVLFGSRVEPRPGGRFRLDDPTGATIAMAVPQSAERERVVEIVSPPLTDDMGGRLHRLLDVAADLGCTVPAEAAVHVHLDAEPFRDPQAFAALVRLFGQHRDELWERFATNTACRRLGPLPDELVALVSEPGFGHRPWAEIEVALHELPLTKFADLNLVNLRDRTPGKDTVEIRILPGGISAPAIMRQVALLAELLEAHAPGSEPAA